jgi:hypothetical protein
VQLFTGWLPGAKVKPGILDSKISSVVELSVQFIPFLRAGNGGILFDVR